MSASGLSWWRSGEYTASKPRSASGVAQRAQLPIQHRPNRAGLRVEDHVVQAIVPMQDPMGRLSRDAVGEPARHVVDGRNRCGARLVPLALPPAELTLHVSGGGPPSELRPTSVGSIACSATSVSASCSPACLRDGSISAALNSCSVRGTSPSMWSIT